MEFIIKFILIIVLASSLKTKVLKRKSDNLEVPKCCTFKFSRGGNSPIEIVEDLMDSVNCKEPNLVSSNVNCKILKRESCCSFIDKELKIERLIESKDCLIRKYQDKVLGNCLNTKPFSCCTWTDEGIKYEDFSISTDCLSLSFYQIATNRCRTVNTNGCCIYNNRENCTKDEAKYISDICLKLKVKEKRFKKVCTEKSGTSRTDSNKQDLNKPVAINYGGCYKIASDIKIIINKPDVNPDPNPNSDPKPKPDLPKPKPNNIDDKTIKQDQNKTPIEEPYNDTMFKSDDIFSNEGSSSSLF